MAHDYSGEIQRLKAEAASFAKRATFQRQEAIDLRKRRQFVEAFRADGRAIEYRNSRDKARAEALRLKTAYT